jgi:hypothetical protein
MSQITQPALFLAGGATAPDMLRIVEELSRLLPRGEVRLLEGLDHIAPMTALAVVAEKVDEFVRRHQAV